MAISRKTIQAIQERDGNKCSICDEDNVMLQLDHIKPLSQGGKDNLKNLRLVCPSCHVNIHKKRELREFEFVNYLSHLLERNRKFRNVRTEAKIGGKGQFEADLVVEEKVHDQWQTIFFECKAGSSFTQYRLYNISTQIASYRKYIGRARVAFAFPGKLSFVARSILEAQDIEIWDSSYISNTFRREIPQVKHPILQPMLMAIKPSSAKSPEERLIEELKLCKPGREEWGKYHKLMGSVIERLFCPPLTTPIVELSDAPKVNRRDFILPNYAEDGFWAFIRSRYSADYITIDAKNHSGEVTKDQVLQITNYLKQHGVGLFGLIICRRGGDRSCIHTLREVWAIHKKLILVLTDDDIEQMLLAKSSGAEPEEIIRKKIEDFRLAL